MARTATAVAAATTSTPMNTAAEPDWMAAGPTDVDVAGTEDRVRDRTEDGDADRTAQ